MDAEKGRVEQWREGEKMEGMVVEEEEDDYDYNEEWGGRKEGKEKKSILESKQPDW